MSSHKHPDFLPIALGVFALVAGYGVVNDQWIAAFSPQHFTVYHPHYFPFEAPWAQALCFGLVATGGPGLAWGILLYWVGHNGSGPVVGRRVTIGGAAAVLLITAAMAWGLGARVAETGEPPYPLYFYPSEDLALYISQTVQLTNYLVGVTGAGLWLAAIAAWRAWRRKTSASQ